MKDMFQTPVRLDLPGLLFVVDLTLRVCRDTYELLLCVGKRVMVSLLSRSLRALVQQDNDAVLQVAFSRRKIRCRHVALPDCTELCWLPSALPRAY